MNRNEAVALYKEIVNLCGNMGSSAVYLTESKPDDQAYGYQIRIKAVIDNECAQQIRSITEKRNLIMKEKNGEIIIFKPKEIAKTT